MNIDENKLREYVEDEEIYVFDSESEFLDFVNTERAMFWSFDHPNDFKSFEETTTFGGEYLLKYKDKYYWVAYEHCLDIYK